MDPNPHPQPIGPNRQTLYLSTPKAQTVRNSSTLQVCNTNTNTNRKSQISVSFMSNPTPTVTQREQWMVESKVSEIYQLFTSLPPHAQALMLELQRDQHMEYLNKGLNQLGPSFCVLDANRPWLCYWILHSIALLGECIDCERQDDAVDFLNRCQDYGGGYGGGPGQMPHLATTYAAVNSLLTLGGEKALSSINREKLHGFLLRMKDPSGGFRMHNAGEMDVRACYTAISVASVLNILDNELVKNVGDYILSCQTYEGGIAGEPGSEAHGGYTFCGLATMILINEADRLDLPGLVDWVVFRQGVEGGFQGRSNKLVDGCYSFWQGCVFALIQRLPSIAGEQLHLNVGKGKQERGSALSVGISNMSEKESDLGTLSPFDERKLSDIGISFIEGHSELGPLFHSVALQQYILLCSQDTYMPGFWLVSQMLAPKPDSIILSGVQEGGFKDKPGKYKDYYHTCYCLSGLSVCQHCWSRDADSSPFPKAVFGPYSNLLEPIHPIYNLVLDRYYEAHNYFSGSEAS